MGLVTPHHVFSRNSLQMTKGHRCCSSKKSGWLIKNILDNRWREILASGSKETMGSHLGLAFCRLQWKCWKTQETPLKDSINIRWLPNGSQNSNDDQDSGGVSVRWSPLPCPLSGLFLRFDTSGNLVLDVVTPKEDHCYDQKTKQKVPTNFRAWGESLLLILVCVSVSLNFLSIVFVSCHLRVSQLWACCLLGHQNHLNLWKITRISRWRNQESFQKCWVMWFPHFYSLPSSLSCEPSWAELGYSQK